MKKTVKKKEIVNRSPNAEAVAKEVIRQVRSGRIVRKGKIMAKFGYSKNSIRASKATLTKTYKETMRPVVEQLERERERAIKAMAGKINKAKYRDLVDAIDKFTKNIELLSGRDTSRVGGLVDDIFDKL